MTWRPGRWLLAVHPMFTLRPNYRSRINGPWTWALWWLWFEVSRA